MRAPARRAAHGRPSHGARRAAAACACGGGVGRLGRGRARAPGGLAQRLAGPRLGGAPAPVGPKLRPSRSAHRPASPRQAAAQRGVVEEGAVLRVVVGHESAPMAQRARPAHTGCAAAARAGSRDARVMTLGGAPRRRSPEAPRSRPSVSAANESPRWSAVPEGSRWTGEAPRRWPWRPEHDAQSGPGPRGSRARRSSKKSREPSLA